MAEIGATIQGFKIQMTSGELVEHLDQKAKYHLNRAEKYAEQAAGVKSVQIEDGGQMNYSNDPSANLAQSAEQHRKKGVYYAFLRDHVSPNGVYQLDDTNLRQIGLYDGRDF